jgi:hypothetical protein
MNKDFAALLRDVEQAAARDPEIAEQLRVASVRAIRRMAAHCADPRSPYHQMALDYMRPRARALAAALSKHATSTERL